MTKDELKQLIKNQTLIIKHLKKELKSEAVKVSIFKTSSLMSRLHSEKVKARAQFVLYAFLRGKRYDSQEKYPSYNYMLSFEVGKFFNSKEAYQVFLNWINETHSAL